MLTTHWVGNWTHNYTVCIKNNFFGSTRKRHLEVFLRSLSLENIFNCAVINCDDIGLVYRRGSLFFTVHENFYQREQGVRFNHKACPTFLFSTTFKRNFQLKR